MKETPTTEITNVGSYLELLNKVTLDRKQLVKERRKRMFKRFLVFLGIILVFGSVFVGIVLQMLDGGWR